jgi:hypothetical protein
MERKGSMVMRYEREGRREGGWDTSVIAITGRGWVKLPP